MMWARGRARFALLVVLAACAGERQRDIPEAFWIGGDVHLGPRHRALLAPGLAELGRLPGIVNLEGPIASGASYAMGEHIVLRNRQEAARLLAASGVKVAGLANNHAGDLGPHGLERTRQELGRRGIAASEPDGAAELSVAGRRVAVLAFDLGHEPPPKEPQLGLSIARRAAQGDLTVALLHVDGPPSYLPGAPLAHAVDLALAAGARVVAVAGTHTLARVERRGDAVIAWGLGNLAFACPCSREEEGLILRVGVRADRKLDAEVIPIRAGLDGRAAEPAPDAVGMIDLLDGLGSSPLRRTRLGARF